MSPKIWRGKHTRDWKSEGDENPKGALSTSQSTTSRLDAAVEEKRSFFKAKLQYLSLNPQTTHSLETGSPFLLFRHCSAYLFPSIAFTHFAKGKWSRFNGRSPRWP
jgi:hypothetical protein